LNAVFIDRVNHVQHLVALLLELLQKGRGLYTSLRFTGDVVDTRLLVVHATDIVLETGHAITRLGRVVPKELGKLSAVGRVLVNPKLDILAEGLIKLSVRILILCQLIEHLNALLHQVLLDDAKDLILLQSLTRDVEGKIL